MAMSRRQALIDVFSTFLQFESSTVKGWVTDTTLRRNFQVCRSQLQPLSPSLEDWALYWHKRWRTEPERSQGHLSAYLQESCYWAAHQTMPKVASLRYGLEDCFQVAIAEVPKILKAFSPGPIGSLRSYSRVAFGNILRDALRQQREIDICSDWSLLLKTSRKRLQSALQNAGLNPKIIAQSLQAWDCFGQIYRDRSPAEIRQRKAPDPLFWQRVSELYSNLHSDLHSPEILEKWLTHAAKYVRSDLYPAVTSLNVSRSTQMSDITGELQDEVPSVAPESLLEELILQEEQSDRHLQRQQLNHVLIAAIAQLEDAMLLDLYYAQNLTQQQIARSLKVQQYTISRRLTKTRTALLMALSRWSQDVLHILPTSNVLNSISAMLEEWLLDYYGPKR